MHLVVAGPKITRLAKPVTNMMDRGVRTERWFSEAMTPDRLEGLN